MSCRGVLSIKLFAENGERLRDVQVEREATGLMHARAVHRTHRAHASVLHAKMLEQHSELALQCVEMGAQVCDVGRKRLKVEQVETLYTINARVIHEREYKNCTRVQCIRINEVLKNITYRSTVEV